MQKLKTDIIVARRYWFGNKFSLWRSGLAICLMMFSCLSGFPRQGYARTDSPKELTPVLVKDINALTLPSNPDQFTPVGNMLYFVADDGVHGRELWRTDGTLTNTQIITDIRPNHSSDPHPLRIFSDTLLFAAVSPSVDVSATHPFDFCAPHQLFSTDGTLSGTLQLTNFPQGIGAFVDFGNMGCLFEAEASAALGGYSFFGSGGELWKTNGTLSGTSKVMTLSLPTVTTPRLTHFVVISNTLFFQLGSGDAVQLGQPLPNPKQLWASDGTVAGTRLARTFPDGILENGVALNGKLLVLAYSPEAGNPYGLWSSDGTLTGTVGLKAFTKPEQLTVLDNRVFFANTDVNDGTTSLWRTDGSVTGTVKVANMPALAGRQWWLKGVGGQLYLRTNIPSGSVSTWELWRLNNAGDGFDLLWRDEDRGLSLPGIWQAQPVFVNSAGVWVIDGKQVRLIASLAIDPSFAANADLSDGASGSNLFMSASDTAHGIELWRLSANGAADVYIDANPIAPARPADRAMVQTRYGNLGSTPLTTVTLTATLDISLTYVSNSLGLTPTIQGNQLVWQLPGVGFLAEHPFDLSVQTPNTPLGSRYPITMTVTANHEESDTSNNTNVISVMIATQTYLPLVMRAYTP